MKTIFIYLVALIIFCFYTGQIIHAQDREQNKNLNKDTVELNSKLTGLKASIAAGNTGISAANKNTTEKNINSSDTKPVAKTSDKNNNKTGQPGTGDVNNGKNNDKKQSKKTEDAYAAEKKKADWIINTIDNSTHKDRKAAISQILTIKDQSLKKNLGEKLVEVIKTEAELEVKVKAITVTGELKHKEALPALIKMLNNEADDVTVAAVYAIKRIGDPSAKPDLINKLKEQKFENNTNLIEALIDTLGDFKAAELSAFASEAVKNVKTHQIIRELFILFLGKIETKEPKNMLLEILNDEDENEQIRAFAANSLANLKITEAIPDIEKLVHAIDSYPFNKKKKFNNLYIYCISSLVKLGYDNAFPMFLNMLRSDNAVVRLKAVSLIKDSKDKRTVDILKYKMLYDPSPKVQSTAKEALKELGIDLDSIKKDSSIADQDKKYNIKNENEKKEETKDNSVDE
jgi:HEAT repeat protein